MLFKHRHLTLLKRTVEAIKKYPDNFDLGGKIRNMYQRELDTYDLPFEEDLCGTCMSCIEACPTQALSEYEIDSEKCISYKTIECREEFFQDEIQLDNWIYGCDICQEVCPWNIKFNQVTQKDNFYPQSEILNWENIDWENLNESTFKNTFKGSSAKRAKFSGLKRNIIKNSG